MGEYGYTAFFLWPLPTKPSHDTPKSFLAHFIQMKFTGFFVFQLLLTAYVFILWRADGSPGMKLVWAEIRRPRFSKN